MHLKLHQMHRDRSGAFIAQASAQLSLYSPPHPKSRLRVATLPNHPDKSTNRFATRLITP